MITLNSDAGLVRLDAWEDVTTRPGFTADVDPKAVQLESIIGTYRFTDYVKCGLSTCHHQHFRGYLVTTKDGRITNIGKDCGKTHFGVDFETMTRTFERDLANAERRETLVTTQHNVDQLLDQVEQLKKELKGATWINRQMTELRYLDVGLPGGVLQHLDDMIRRHSPVITRQRQATKAEIEVMRETGQLRGPWTGDPVYITEEIGTLRGLAVLYPENNVRQILIENLYKGLEHIRAMNVSHASEHELRTWAKWAGEIDTKLRKAREIVDMGRQFFDTENLAQLAELAESPDEEKRVMALARSYRGR